MFFASRSLKRHQ